MDEVTYMVNLIRNNWPSAGVMNSTLGIATAHRVKPTILDIRNLSSGGSTDGTAGKVSRGQARQYNLLNQTVKLKDCLMFQEFVVLRMNLLCCRSSK